MNYINWIGFGLVLDCFWIGFSAKLPKSWMDWFAFYKQPVPIHL